MKTTSATMPMKWFLKKWIGDGKFTLYNGLSYYHLHLDKLTV